MLLLLAILPGLALFLFVWKHDTVEKEPPGLILRLFLFGAATIISAVVIGLIGESVVTALIEPDTMLYLIIDNFLLTALVEEGGKYFVLKKTTWRHPAFNYTFDAVIYAVTVSLGFAVLENIAYVMEGGIETALLRAVMSVPGHAIFGVFMGYYFGLAKAADSAGDSARTRSALRRSLLVPVLLHGFYDFSLSTEIDFLYILFFVFEIVITAVAFKRLKTLSKTDTPVV